jgi:hypothetical protein
MFHEVRANIPIVSAHNFWKIDQINHESPPPRIGLIENRFWPSGALAWSLKPEEGDRSLFFCGCFGRVVVHGRLRFATTGEFLQRFGLASVGELTAASLPAKAPAIERIDMSD